MEKTVKVSREIHERLTRLGAKGETYNNIIERLLVFYEARHLGEKKSPPK